MKTMYIGGKMTVNNTVYCRFSDSEYYIDIMEKLFITKSVEISKSVFEVRIGNSGKIRLLYNVDKAASVPQLEVHKVKDSFYTDGELEVLKRKGVLKTKSYDGMTLYSFDETPNEKSERLRNSIKSLQRVIVEGGLLKRVQRVDEMVDEKDALLISTNFTLPRSQVDLYELLFQRRLEQMGVRSICEVSFDVNDNVSMLVRLFPLIK